MFLDSNALDKIFAALADPTRRGILARLATGAASVSELAQPFSMSQPAISRHLKILEDAGLVSSQVDGQRRPRELKTDGLDRAGRWIARYQEIWENNYLKLDALLEELQQPFQPRKAKSKKVRGHS